MNRFNWMRGHRVRDERGRRCETEGHDWYPEAGPITERRHCRRCTAFQPGIPDEYMRLINAGFVRVPLGWLKEKGAEFLPGECNPAYKP